MEGLYGRSWLLEMLSEGYLCGLSYWSEEDTSYYEVAAVGTEEELESICRLRHSSVALSKDSMCCHAPLQQFNGNSLFERQTSPFLEISGDTNVNKEMYLVPSSCKSICKNYNDLHIAGDQVMPMNSVMTDFTCDSSFEFCDGPFLESSQIPPTMESVLAQRNEPPWKQIKGDSSVWRVGSGRDKSIMQHQQPLSNSVLNEYLEQKVMELYKQYLMDCVVNNSSPNQIMASELIMNNVDQISMQISREQNMATTKAKDMVINCLLRLASEKMSAEISTPQLQISSDDNIQ